MCKHFGQIAFGHNTQMLDRRRFFFLSVAPEKQLLLSVTGQTD